jgi:hypothetical protein
MPERPISVNYAEQQKMRERMKEMERLVRAQEASNSEVKGLLEMLAARIAALETSKTIRLPKK